MKIAIKWLLYALVLSPLVVTRSLFFPYISGKSILLRLVVTVVAVLFCVLVFIYKNESIKIKERFKILVRNKIFLLVCAFFFILILSTIFAGDSYRAFFGDTERAEGLLTMLYLFGLFLFSSLVFEKNDWINFFKGTILVGYALFVYEMVQLIGGADRPGASTGNSIYLATIFLFVIFSAWIVLNDLYTKVSSPDEKKTKRTIDKIWKWGTIFVIPLSIFGIFVTRTRGVIAGLVLSIILLLIFFIIKGKESYLRGVSVRKISSMVLGFIVLIGAIFLATSDSTFWSKIPGVDRLSEFTLNDATLQTRLISLGVSLHAINPSDNGAVKFLIGWGPENFGTAYNTYYNPEYFRYEHAWFDRAHNKLMDVFVMNGILGFVSYVGFWIALWWAIIRRKTDNEKILKDIGAPILFFSVAYFIQNLFVFDSIVTYVPFFMFFAFAISSVSKENKSEEINHIKESNYVWLPYFFCVFALFLVFSFIAWTIIPYGQTYSYTKLVKNGSITEEDISKILTPYTFVQELVRTQFLRSVNGAYTGKEEEKKMILFAIDKVREVVDLEPDNPRYLIPMGDSYDLLGKNGEPEYLKKSEEIYARAHELAPKRQDIYYMMAYNFAFQKRFDEAIETIKEAVHLDPQVAAPHFYLGMILIGSEKDEYFREAFNEIYLAQKISGNAFGKDKNGPQAVYFLLARFYNAHDAEYSLEAADLLDELLPEKKSQIDILRKAVLEGTWKKIIFK